MKFVFVSGGVVSGLGKGVTAASMGMLLKAKGYEVTNVKIDMYLNVDAGTIRPQEHGEVFVTDDGIETDQDLGNYERFLDQSLRRENYMTTGQVYLSVINKERSFGYEGEDVEAIPHVTDEIIGRIRKAGRVNKAEIVIVELGGTVGEYQNALFFEASRILKLNRPKDVIQVHVSYLPVIKSLGELKSKPAQQSVRLLNSMGIQPDILIARSEKEIDKRRRERLAMFCNMKDEDIIANPDLNNIYEVPLFMEEQKLAEKVLKKLGLRSKGNKIKRWQEFVRGYNGLQEEVEVGIVGKYLTTGDYTLADSYLCVSEAIKHAGAYLGVKPKIRWLSCEMVEKEGCKKCLNGLAGIIVPQGWGSRGVEAKIKTVEYARKNKIPYLGLCFGMQMAVAEFARNGCGLEGANSEEVNRRAKYKVVHVMPKQQEYLKKHQYGGTIRLGSWPCRVKEGSVLEECFREYGRGENVIDEGVINERHRHRYEVNNEYREILEKKGLVISGVSPDGQLTEAVELPKSKHPFFVGVQFHPEYKSRPLSPHPLFVGWLKAAREKKG
jgi:CTP synthase